jgi:hypothetical protein
VGDNYGYRAVPDDYVIELGKVVVIAGLTERAAHEILECLA